jgi:uncharacterized oligopeptide transporter (OPT) family protein
MIYFHLLQESFRDALPLLITDQDLKQSVVPPVLVLSFFALWCMRRHWCSRSFIARERRGSMRCFFSISYYIWICSAAANALLAAVFSRHIVQPSAIFAIAHCPPCLIVVDVGGGGGGGDRNWTDFSWYSWYLLFIGDLSPG